MWTLYSLQWLPILREQLLRFKVMQFSFWTVRDLPIFDHYSFSLALTIICALAPAIFQGFYLYNLEQQVIKHLI